MEILLKIAINQLSGINQEYENVKTYLCMDGQQDLWS